MKSNRLNLQIHSLISFAGALLNRDDTGAAKRLPFGGCYRTRISSQCLKRHWRTDEGEFSLSGLGEPMSVRSRHTFQRLIVDPLVKEGLDKEVVEAAAIAVKEVIFGKSKKSKESKKDEEESIKTNQITVLGLPEIRFLRSEVRDIASNYTGDKGKKLSTLMSLEVGNRLGREGKKNLRGLKMASGLDSALFGRMVTSDALARGDAAVQVAHAFTVHAEQVEDDFFTAVDSLGDGEGEGLQSGHLNTVELTSGLYYIYVNVDVPLLVSNLTGCERKDWKKQDLSLTTKVIGNLIHLVAEVTPGAKLGSTAPYSYPHAILIETSESTPIPLDTAFEKAIDGRGDIVASTYKAVADLFNGIDWMRGVRTKRFLSARGPKDILEEGISNLNTGSMQEMVEWVGSQLLGDEA